MCSSLLHWKITPFQTAETETKNGQIKPGKWKEMERKHRERRLPDVYPENFDIKWFLMDKK